MSSSSALLRLLPALAAVPARRLAILLHRRESHVIVLSRPATYLYNKVSHDTHSTSTSPTSTLTAIATATVATIAATLGLRSGSIGNCDASASNGTNASSSQPSFSATHPVDPPTSPSLSINVENPLVKVEDRYSGAVDEPSHDWKDVIKALREAQRSDTSAAGFRAVRRPVTSSTSTSSGWAHDFEFPLLNDADLYGVLLALAHGLGGASGSSIKVEDSGTRRLIILTREKGFQATVSVPRVMTLEGRVSINVWKGSTERFSHEELHGLVNAYRSSQTSINAQLPSVDPHLLDGQFSIDLGPPTFREKPPPKTKSEGRFKRERESESRSKAREKLEEMGIEVFDVEDNKSLTWDALAGYKDVKQRIEDTLTLPLQHPEVYESIVARTRTRAETNVPKAVLYEGPPGCGKTFSARILAATIGIPFVHVRVEALLSKYYGETTRKMSDVLETANDMGRCIVFLDECDSVGLRRSGGSSDSSSGDVHEVTRRTLSVLLRFIDGMDGAKNAIVLAATNHKEDLDAALVSRFDVIVSFPLPDLDTRVAMLKLYAKQLSEDDLLRIAKVTWGFSGRELVDVCEEAERTKAGMVVREKFKPQKEEERDEEDYVNEANSDDETSFALPDVQDYIDAVERKAEHVIGRWNEQFADASTLQRLLHDDAHSGGNMQEQQMERGQPKPISTEN